MSREESRPETGNPNFIGCLLAASGATLLAFVMTLTSVASVAFAVVKLTGLPDVILYGLLVLGIVPVLAATIWTAGRAWHVENRLERGLDIDQPDFSIFGYFRRRPE
ncbi:MAG TPA: hypothetical protein VJS40_04035 [Aestuariivirgaceae bacterium]|nr:hypothetical protein [Aestuariivirgaceae bacterium]